MAKKLETAVSDTERVRMVMDRWLRLTSEQDVDGILALTADDVVFLTPGNEPIGKEQFAAGMRDVMAKARIESVQEVKEVRTSADVAYAWSHLSVDLIAKDGGGKVHNEGYALTVFRRSAGGEWLVARDANLVLGAGNPDRI
jgi:uncharacterized protein (TIGR02246 family)